MHLYALCWNEARVLPYFFRHYSGLVDKFFIFDNGSTDGSLDLLAGDERVSVARWEVRGDSFVREARDLNNRFWKPSRGLAEWVIVVDIDEHLYHPDFRDYLRRCRASGISVMQPVGYDMIADEFPTEQRPLWQMVTRGVRAVELDKRAVFDPTAIDDMHYEVGRHHASPSGRVGLEPQPQITLLHYKWLGAAYVAERNRILSRGIRPGDVGASWGLHYFLEAEEVAAEHAALRDLAEPVAALTGATGADHPVGDERAIIRASGLFHDRWYLRTYTDVAAIGMDPLQHFCLYGWREGRRPNRYFDCAWYLDTYAGAIGRDGNPLLDYIAAGERAGRLPSPGFDPRMRRRLVMRDSRLRRLLAGLATAQRLGIGFRLFDRIWARWRSLPMNFDAAAYLAANPDVANAGIDAVRHYVRCGRREGRPLRPPDRKLAERAERRLGLSEPTPSGFGRAASG